MFKGVIIGYASHKVHQDEQKAPNDPLVTESNLYIYFTSRLKQESGSQWLALIQLQMSSVKHANFNFLGHKINQISSITQTTHPRNNSINPLTHISHFTI